jgi:hypothetical protein
MRRIPRSLALFSTMFPGVVSIGLCPAQTSQTSLRGTVHDPGGAVVYGATVSIENAKIGFTQSRISGDRGAYAFEEMPPGRYTVESSANGFARQRFAMQLLVSQPSTLKIPLGVAGFTTTVEAFADALSFKTSADLKNPLSQLSDGFFGEAQQFPCIGRDDWTRVLVENKSLS